MKEPETTDCAMETMKNGENRVPETSEEEADFTTQRARNKGKSKEREERTATLESPSLKNGANLGSMDSAYEKSRANAPRYAILSFRDSVTLPFRS